MQTGDGKNQRVEFAGIELSQARVHIAAQVDDLIVRKARLQLTLPAQAGRTDARTVRKFGQTGVAVRYERIPWVRSLEYRGNREIVGHRHREIFHRMHRQVDALVVQRLFELCDEQSFSARRRERPVKYAIAFGRDFHKLDLQIGSARKE